MPSSISRSTTSASYSIVDAEALGGQIERVEHRAAAAEEERVGAAEAQRAAERGLEAHALLRRSSRACPWTRGSCGARAPRRSGRRVTRSRSLQNSSSG